MQSVTISQDGEILVLSVNNPPVNALSWHVRQGISDGIEQGLKDDSVKAIVIRCEGQTFIAGADITEFGKPPQGPDFNAVLNTIETATKPVIAAIHGTALGGGLEFALAGHYRVAADNPKIKLGLPEAKGELRDLEQRRVDVTVAPVARRLVRRQAQNRLDAGSASVMPKQIGRESVLPQISRRLSHRLCAIAQAA